MTAWAKEKVAPLVNTPEVRAAELRLQQEWQQRAKTDMRKLRIMIYSALGVFVVFYFFICYCLKLICDKTGNPPGVMIWLPGLQTFPLLRAAGMSPLWFLAYLFVVPGLVAHLLWCIKIAQARDKSVWAGIFLFLPITWFFALLYLAFSEGGPPEKEEPVMQVMCLDSI
jgi:hypothetical protein